VLATLIALIMLLSALITGRLLPTWMFLNTLQLMSHLPLIKSQLPAPAAYFMSQFLDLTRFNLLWPILKSFAIEYGYYNEGALNMTFEAYGYASLYIWGNMPSLIVLAFVILAFWIIALLKGSCTTHTNRAFEGSVRDIFMLNKHAVWMTNFAVRFWYEAYIFVCMSVLISLTKSGQENVIPEMNDEHNPESKHAKVDKALALILLVMIVATLALAIWRLVEKNYLTGVFDKTNRWCLDLARSKKKDDNNEDALKMDDS